MIKKSLKLLFFLLALIGSLYVNAQQDSSTEKLSLDKMKAKISLIFGGVPVSEIELQDNKVPDYYLVRVGSSYGLISYNGKIYIEGDAWELDSRINITDALRSGFNLSAIKGLGDVGIDFKAKKEKSFVWVYSDIQCYYCRKLHSEMSQINDLGLTVKYISYPRSGNPKSEDWLVAQKVWCAKNRQEAMTLSKAGKSIDNLPQRGGCSANIKQQFQSGRLIGVNGTPSIVFANGKMVSGYMPANQLLQVALDNQVK